MTNKIQLYLASTSPRRQELLTQIGLAFQCLPNDVSEIMQAGESPINYADRLALQKAQAGWHSAKRNENCPVLGADTVVVLNKAILGKPADKEECIRTLLLLSGKTHEVMTSIALVQNNQIAAACSISRVQFREITFEEAAAYWETGEPADKAGGYAIQGKGAVFIKHIEGSYSGIMGLPLYETATLLREFSL